MNGRSKSVVMAFAMAMAVGLAAEASGSRRNTTKRRTSKQRVSRTTTGTRSTRRAPAYGHKTTKPNGYDSPGDDTYKPGCLRYDSPGDDTFKARRLGYDSPGDDTFVNRRVGYTSPPEDSDATGGLDISGKDKLKLGIPESPILR